MDDIKHNGPLRYRIHALGVLSPGWLSMLSGDWAIVDQPVLQPASTILVGRVADQAALMGVLNHLYNIGHYLLSLECLVDERDRAYPDWIPQGGLNPREE